MCMYVFHTQEEQGPPLYSSWLVATGSLRLSKRKRATKGDNSNTKPSEDSSDAGEERPSAGVQTAQWKHLLAHEVIHEARTNPV